MIDLRNLKRNYILEESKVIELLGQIKDYSDETFRHSIDVANKAFEVGTQLNLDAESLKLLYTAALVHDVGKLKIKKEILHNTGTLSEEEFAEMKKHVLYSNEILEKYNFDQRICKLAFHHHEKLNGKGYPQGISELMILDKILTVCDIVSALRLKRSYKDPYSYSKCEFILKDMANKGELDKNIVRLSLKNLKMQYRNRGSGRV